MRKEGALGKKRSKKRQNWGYLVEERCNRHELRDGTGAAFEELLLGYRRRETVGKFEPPPRTWMSLQEAWGHIKERIDDFQLGWDPTCKNADGIRPFAPTLFWEVQEKLPTQELKERLLLYRTLGTKVDDAGADALLKINITGLFPRWHKNESLCFIDAACYRKEDHPEIVRVYPTVFRRRTRRIVVHKIVQRLLGQLPKGLARA